MAGIPVLASNIQTFQEYIDKYEVGLTVDPHNIQAITDTIKSMISDEDKMIKWQQNARKASEELNWESESKKMNQIYEEIQY
jgi:glycosyltransferase involved in cell wall biosynthesis